MASSLSSHHTRRGQKEQEQRAGPYIRQEAGQRSRRRSAEAYRFEASCLHWGAWIEGSLPKASCPGADERGRIDHLVWQLRGQH